MYGCRYDVQDYQRIEKDLNKRLELFKVDEEVVRASVVSVQVSCQCTVLCQCTMFGLWLGWVVGEVDR